MKFTQSLAAAATTTLDRAFPAAVYATSRAVRSAMTPMGVASRPLVRATLPLATVIAAFGTTSVSDHFGWVAETISANRITEVVTLVDPEPAGIVSSVGAPLDHPRPIPYCQPSELLLFLCHSQLSNQRVEQPFSSL